MVNRSIICMGCKKRKSGSSVQHCFWLFNHHQQSMLHPQFLSPVPRKHVSFVTRKSHFPHVSSSIPPPSHSLFPSPSLSLSPYLSLSLAPPSLSPSLPPQVKKVDAKEELQKTLSDLDIEHWENKRVPRPTGWE